MKSRKYTVLMVLAVLTILSLLLSACGAIDRLHLNVNHGKEKDGNKEKIKNHGDETDNKSDMSANKITICHKTGSAKHPYVEISVSNDAFKEGHAKHEGDIIPAPEDGCPTTAVDKSKGNESEAESETDISANKITICHKTGSAKHPYVVISVSNNAVKNGHAKHQGDIIPAAKEGCPTTVPATSLPNQ